MPIATIHVLEGRYDERRLSKVSTAVQDALVGILKIPPDDFFQIIHVFPPKRFLHTPSFLGLKYSDDFILLELAFISGRSRETRLALLKELNARIVAGAGISPDDLMVHLSEDPGENYSFGQGLAQRAVSSQRQEEVPRALIDAALPAVLKSSSDSGGQTNLTEAVIIAALVRAKPGKEEELARRLHALVEASRSDRGVITYDLHHSLEDPALWFLYERYQSQEHLNKHLENTVVRSFLADSATLVEGRVDIRKFRLASERP
jgi:quinol monooxygenase YgiN/phenylpyruvate tautomerase PptA (4-oxalocrotonate tautomerase family)